MIAKRGDARRACFVEFFTANIRNPNTRKAYYRAGQTPVLVAAEARQLLDRCDTATPVGLRDRALIALLVFTFARIGAALGMDRGRRLPAAPALVGPPARERRQGTQHALPP